MTNADYDAVRNHYTSGDLETAILDGLRAAGKDLDALSIDDLAPVDQFHAGGMNGTLELMRLAEFEHGTRILDVGGGLGGAARVLATKLDASVTVLDLNQAFCEVGELLTQLTGLSHRVSFQQGDALEPPFSDRSFDAAWMQNAGMNVKDKPRLYREIFQVLRPGGRFALQEIVAGPVQPVHYPTAWATDASMSFLIPAADLRALVKEIGFREVNWVENPQISQAWRERQFPTNASSGSLPPLGFHLFLGQDRLLKVQAAAARNNAENRIGLIRAVMDRWW
jgi:SAM-dependent methyltransferase